MERIARSLVVPHSQTLVYESNRRSHRIYLQVRLCLLIGLVFATRAFAQPELAEPVQVTVGAYINDVQALNLREHSYAMDVYLWFRWEDDELVPAETVEVVNPNELWGHVADAQYEEPIRLPTGEWYQVLRVQGRFSHKFFFYNYPYDRQELVVEFEDETHEVNRLEYVPDADPVAVNPRLVLPGFHVGAANLTIEPFSYPTAFGDSRRSEPNCYSRVRVAIPISPRIDFESKDALARVMRGLWCLANAATQGDISRCSNWHRDYLAANRGGNPTSQ